MEGCQGVYKKLPPTYSGPQENNLHDNNPQENNIHSNNHHSNNQHHHNHSTHPNNSILNHHIPIEANISLGSDVASNSSGVQSLDFYYEDKLIGDLDNISVIYDDSDFEDSMFSDESSLNSSNLNSYNASFGQCLKSAF